MNDYGNFDLDEHAAFWAREDERAGVADERFEFDIGGENLAARGRRARSVRAGAHERDRENYFYEIGEGRAMLVSDSALFPLPPTTKIEDYLESRYYCFRPFCPREAARYSAKIYPDGTGEWFYRTQDKKGNLGFLSQSPFRLMDEPTPAEFLQLPQTEFLDLCAQQWHSPASELRQSYEFDQLSLAERDAQVLRCENGDAGELRRLMDLLAHLIWSEAARLDFRFENILWFDLQSDELMHTWNSCHDGHLNRIYKAWRVAIFGALKPSYIGRESPTHIQSWLSQGRHSLNSVVESSTAHEQLETQLQLREWARRYLSEAERNELFGLSK